MEINSLLHSNIEWTITPDRAIIVINNDQIAQIKTFQYLIRQHNLSIIRVDGFPTVSESLLCDDLEEYDETSGEITYRGADLVVFRESFRFRWYNKHSEDQEIWTDHQRF